MLENRDDFLPARVENAALKLGRADLMRLTLEEMPEAMRDHSIPEQDDWIGWKIVPSTVREDELDALQERLCLRPPPLYRKFLQLYYFYELLGLRFIDHPIGNWRDELEAAYDTKGVGIVGASCHSPRAVAR